MDFLIDILVQGWVKACSRKGERKQNKCWLELHIGIQIVRKISIPEFYVEWENGSSFCRSIFKNWLDILACFSESFWPCLPPREQQAKAKYFVLRKPLMQKKWNLSLCLSLAFHLLTLKLIWGLLCIYKWILTSFRAQLGTFIYHSNSSAFSV